MKNRLCPTKSMLLVTLTLGLMVVGAVKLGICMPPPPPPPPAAPSAPATPAGTPTAIAPDGSTPTAVQDFGVPTSRFTKQDGAPEVDENKRGFTDSGDRAILDLYAQGNSAIQAMDAVLAQMGNLYVEASRKFFDADTTIDTTYQQASFNLGVLQQISQRTEEASKKPQTDKKPQAGITAEQQASVTEINQTLERIKQNKTAFNQLFSQINDAIGQGKTMASQARQKNLQILQLPNAAAGQALIDEIKGLGQNLSQLFDQLQSGAFKNFNTTFDQLNTSAQAVNALIQKLQAKSFTLQVAQEQQQQKVDQQTQQQAEAKQPTTFVSWFIPEEKAQAPAAGEATVIHYIFKKAADALTYCIEIVYKAYVYVKDFVVSKFSSKPATPTAAQEPKVAAQTPPAVSVATPPQQPTATPPTTTPQQPDTASTATPPVPPTTPAPAMPAMPQTMPS